MKTIDNLKRIFEETEKRYNSLLDSWTDTHDKDICPVFNALLFAISDACNVLENGLDGKFPWEQGDKNNE